MSSMDRKTKSIMNGTTKVVAISVGVLLVILAAAYLTSSAPKDAKEREARERYDDECRAQLVNTGKWCPPYQSQAGSPAGK